jgi:hypothetical protein
VNIRHVYKTEWFYLEAYVNTDTPDTWDFCFDRETMIRVLAKTKTLTGYSPGVIHPQMSYLRQTAPTDEVDDEGYYEEDPIISMYHHFKPAFALLTLHVLHPLHIHTARPVLVRFECSSITKACWSCAAPYHRGGR